MTTRFQNPEIEALTPRGRYREEDLTRLETALVGRGTLTFSSLPTGLFPASTAGESIAASGYANVWVRDNVYVAFAHDVIGQTSVAAGAASALLTFYDRHRQRFEDVISGSADPNDVARRPHVRFDGRALAEIADERWAHAQNDALGYFIWLYARLALRGVVALNEVSLSTLALFPRYFEALRYWEDEDSGHWEETRKISASSIGTVVAGLDALLAAAEARGSAFHGPQFGPQLIALTADLAERGRAALRTILPHECAQLSPRQNRRYDAALLFLLFPLYVIDDERMAALLIHDVNRYLAGDWGIRRYLGDSYFAPDYEDRLPAHQRTRDFSDDVQARDALLERIGDEAQWCLFDPILSAYHGRRFQSKGDVLDLDLQQRHLSRALAQVTASWRCPELYYLKRGEYVPNPHTPLQWTQANLAIALASMRESLRAGGRRER